MSAPGRSNPSHLATDKVLLDALSRLAAKGAYAAPVDPDLGLAGSFTIVSPRGAHARATQTLDGNAVAAACRRGWLMPADGANCYRIAVAGIEALRRAKSETPASPGRAHSAPKAARKAASRAVVPQRTVPEGPLAWLRQRKDKDGQRLITEPQFAAGERLGTDFWHAQLSPRVTANWSAAAMGPRIRRAAPGAGVDLNDNVVAARTRVHRALAAVGPELAGILVDVCCHDIGLETAGRTQGWPQRAAKVVLQLGLTRLARHYGMLAPEPPPGASRLRHWGGEGYRPDLDAWRSNPPGDG